MSLVLLADLSKKVSRIVFMSFGHKPLIGHHIYFTWCLLCMYTVCLHHLAHICESACAYAVQILVDLICWLCRSPLI